MSAEGGGRKYNQSHVPMVRSNPKPWGGEGPPTSRAGVADVATATGESSCIELDHIWEGRGGQKLYITGGMGATARGEAFGPA